MFGELQKFPEHDGESSQFLIFNSQTITTNN